VTGERKRVFATPAGVALCTLDSLADRSARNFVLEIDDAYFFGFVVRVGDEVRGYVDRCPHQGLPLAQKLDQYLSPDRALIECSHHGALFRIEDGACVGGPCVGARLTPWPVRVDGPFVRTA
jgi:nitrite reductase/ring-hydroxylating ferredoxin subunit